MDIAQGAPNGLAGDIRFSIIFLQGMWFEEMINNRNKSFVRDMKWDGSGMKICIVYEDGVIIVGSSDGKRLWAHEQNKKLTLVEWSPDGQLILASTAEGECYVYDAFGHLCDVFILFPSDRHTVGPLTCMTWHRQNSSCSEVSRPSLVRQMYSVHHLQRHHRSTLNHRRSALKRDWSN